MEWEDLFSLAGRVLIAAIFLASSFGKITNFSGTVEYMENAGMFWAPFFCAAATLIESMGGISLAVGYKARWGAVLLAAYLIPVTWIFHAAAADRTQLLKNIAIIGGLLQVAAFGPGVLSLDGDREE